MRVPGPTRYVPVPEELTTPTPTPEAPAPLCIDPYQNPVLCSRDLVIWHWGMRRALEDCNADKAAIGSLKDVPDGR